MNNHHGKEKESNCCSKNAYGLAKSMKEMDFNRSLWGACVTGDLERIERLISKGVDVNAEDSSGYAPLHYATRNGYIQACSVLLKNGAYVNKKTRSGQATSLHHAAYADHEEVVKVLLAATADPCAQDSYGCTSLHKAGSICCHKLVENYKLLDETGKLGIVELNDDLCRSLLLLQAVKQGHQRIVNMLTNANIKVFEIRDNKVLSAATCRAHTGALQNWKMGPLAK